MDRTAAEEVREVLEAVQELGRYYDEVCARIDDLHRKAGGDDTKTAVGAGAEIAAAVADLFERLSRPTEPTDDVVARLNTFTTCGCSDHDWPQLRQDTVALIDRLAALTPPVTRTLGDQAGAPGRVEVGPDDPLYKALQAKPETIAAIERLEAANAQAAVAVRDTLLGTTRTAGEADALADHFPTGLRSTLHELRATGETFESPIRCECHCGESFAGTDEQEVRQLWAEHVTALRKPATRESIREEAFEEAGAVDERPHAFVAGDKVRRIGRPDWGMGTVESVQQEAPHLVHCRFDGTVQGGFQFSSRPEMLEDFDGAALTTKDKPEESGNG